jgi:hypothetical protein
VEDVRSGEEEAFLPRERDDAWDAVMRDPSEVV